MKVSRYYRFAFSMIVLCLGSSSLQGQIQLELTSAFAGTNGVKAESITDGNPFDDQTPFATTPEIIDDDYFGHWSNQKARARKKLPLAESMRELDHHWALTELLRRCPDLGVTRKSGISILDESTLISWRDSDNVRYPIAQLTMQKRFLQKLVRPIFDPLEIRSYSLVWSKGQLQFRQHILRESSRCDPSFPADPVEIIPVEIVRTATAIHLIPSQGPWHFPFQINVSEQGSQILSRDLATFYILAPDLPPQNVGCRRGNTLPKFKSWAGEKSSRVYFSFLAPVFQKKIWILMGCQKLTIGTTQLTG